MTKSVLFISWDGPATNYLQSLFLPLFKELETRGYRFHVLQFSWAPKTEVTRLRDSCATEGIRYRRVKIWRTPKAFGALATAAIGSRKISRTIKDWDIDMLMPRSVMPLLAVLMLGRAKRLPTVYDSDGLGVDEKVDFEGLASGGLLHLFLRVVELRGLQVSNLILSRTPEGRNVLLNRAGSGVNPEKFALVRNGRPDATAASPLRPPSRGRKGDEKFFLCYVGSVGTQYRSVEMVRMAAELKDSFPNLQFLVLTRHLEAFQNALGEFDLNGATWIQAKTVEPREIPDVISRCDLAISMRQKTFSTQGVQPVKLGDYLLAGLPIIGDSSLAQSQFLQEQGVYWDADSHSFEQTVEWIEDCVIADRSKLRAKCINVGKQFFAVALAATDYDSALKEIQETP